MQDEKLQCLYKEEGIEETLSLQKVEFSTLSLDTYSFTKRVTEKELIREYLRNLKDAQEEYKNKVEIATKLLQMNLKKCQEMDSILGTFDDMDNTFKEDIDKPTANETCPIHMCNSTVVKLKRHLAIHKLNEEKTLYAMQCSKLFSKNRKTSKPSASLSKEMKSNTCLVNRKLNYKICPICKNLYMNMTDHLQHAHKMKKTDPDYEKFVTTCKIVPRCYTKIVKGKATMLGDQFLEEARDKQKDIIVHQHQMWNNLKNLRKEMEDTSERIKLKPTEEDKEKLKQLRQEYAEERYRNPAILYPERVQQWRTAFEQCLNLRGDSNPKRGVAMITEIIYPSYSSKEWSLENLLNVKNIKILLNEFKCKKSTNSTTKIKYIRYFESFIKFLATDISSPEFTENLTNDETIAKDIKLKAVSHEIDRTVSILSKNRGKDLMEARAKAKKKLIDIEELNTILKENREFLKEISEMDEAVLKEMNLQEVRKIRDSLIITAIIRLSRRSKELVSMSLEEYSNPEDCIVGGENFKIIHVSDQKNARTGKAAPIAFHECEYAALTAYVTHLRPKIDINSSFKNVFLTCNTQLTEPSPLNYSSLYKIMQKFTSKSGKKLSSRALRGSRITDSRNKNHAHEQRTMSAETISHSLLTADKNDNFSDITNSGVASLALQNNQDTSNADKTHATIPATSNPVKTFRQANAHNSKFYEHFTLTRPDS